MHTIYGLKGLNLNIKPGELHAIMGPNGSGKSTLANVLSGKNGYKVSGEVNFNGENSLKVGSKTIHNSQRYSTFVES